MRLTDTDRGFALLLHETACDGPEATLLQHSSAIDPANPTGLALPGSSYLWVSDGFHLDRAEVRELVARMTRWLETGSMRGDGE
jgi:hypothetical protein